MTQAEIEAFEQLWDEFLRRWPLEKLESMTIEEYTAKGTSDSFTYWLESRTDKLGSIWGGSSFKFGVYSRRDTTEKVSGGKLGYTKEYGWLNKYGESPEKAFQAVRQEVVRTAQAARSGSLDVIDTVDLGHAFRWKIAFMYQDREDPSIVGIYNRKFVRELLGNSTNSTSEIQRQLMVSRGTRSLFVYGSELWERIGAMKENPLTVEMAFEYLKQSDLLTPIKQPTKALAGFESDNGLHLALRLETDDVSLYLSPGDWLTEESKHYKKIKEYDKKSPRSSNLDANAPKLALGYPCVKISVNTLDNLIQLVDTYTTQDEIGSKAIKESNMIQEKPQAGANAPHNQILFGPPGTGKTYITTQYAVSIADPEWVENYFLPLSDNPEQQRAKLKMRYLELIDEKRIVFTTFHQSFSYEDFIEGIRPETNGDKGKLTYSVKDGIFKELCLNAQESQQTNNAPYVMIIDEINRGNISRIFGELITLIESSKRKGAADEQITKLPYSQQPFGIPNNVYLIGTMNTADKSLAQMDLALRRRFNFIEVPSEPRLLQGIEVHGVDLGEVLDSMNQRIEALLDAEHMIGHSYFISLKGMITEQERNQALGLIFKNKVLPLLQEYFFDDYERIGWVLNDPMKEPDYRFIQTPGYAINLTALSKLFSADIAEQITDRRFKINNSAFELAKAYQGIIA